MSNTVDERIVSMQFDNQHFEKNVQTSLGTIDKLKQSLKFTGATKGLEDVNDAAKNVNMSPLGNAVEQIGIKFNAMHAIAYSALNRITNAAMDAGIRITKSLTIDPVKMGFQEYETQINAVQTILANTESKGKTLDDVNSALDELNTYADKTIYNFTEMTRNIGTFTAAGVDLDTSVAAIKGIANLAAVSGSTSQQASTAMYQLSQALSSGTVKLMDWNSVVNAGMGGQVFQDALKETARVHGVAIDDLIKKEGSFRETLQHGWLSSEILTETLSKFTGDLTEEQLKSMGYTEEQIAGILKMGQTANDAATKVKTFTQLLDTLKEAAQSGWTQTWEIIVGDFEEAKALWTKVSDTIGEMIGNSAEARNELLENWKVLGGRDDLFESIGNAFNGILNVIKPIKEAFREIFPPTTAEKLAGFTAGLKELTSKFTLSDTASENLKRTFKGLFAVIDIVRQFFVALVKAGASLFGIVGDLGGGILGLTGSLGDWLVALNDAIRDSDIFSKVLFGVADVVKAAFKGVSAFAKFIKTKIVSPGMEVFRALLESISEKMSGVSGAASGMRDGVVSAFDSMSSALEQCSLFKLISSLWNGLVKVASAVATVAGSLIGGFLNKLGKGDFQGIFDFITTLISGGLALSLAKFISDLGSTFDGIGEIFEGLGDCLGAFQAKLQAEALLKIGQAIALLAASLLVLSLIDSEKMGAAIGAISMLFTELLVAMRILTSFNKGKGLIGTTVAIVSLSASMLVLSAALKIMSTMSLSEMGVGLTSLAVGLGLMVGAVNLLPSDKVSNAAKAIRKMSTAMLILAVAIKIMSTMSWSEMGVGLVTMGAGLGLMVGAVNLLPTNKVTSAAAAIRKMSVAMLILSVAIKIMSTMSWKEMGVGLITMVAGLAALVGAVNLLPKDTSIRALGMISLATSMVILAGALKIMATMSWGDFAKGMATLGGSILILSVGLHAMKGTASGSAAMLLAVVALTALTPVLLILGAMSWGAIAKGLIAVAGAFAVIGVAAVVLKPLLPVITGLASAMALIGVGVLAAGLGLMAFGAGLTSLAVGLTALVGSIGVISAGLIKLIESIVVGIIKGVGKGIIALCKVIADSAGVIGLAIKELILATCGVLVECVPVIAETILKVLVGLLDSLATYTPQIVDGLFKFVIGLLQSLADHIPDFIKVVFDIVASVFTGVIDALKSVDPDALLKGVLAVGLMAGVLAALSAVTGLIPSAMVGVLGMGVVIAELALVLAAIGALAQIPGLTWLINEGGKLLESIGTAIGSLIGGILGGIAKGATSSLPEIGSNLSEFMTNVQPFLDGAAKIDPSIMDGVKSLIGVIVSLTGANILESLTSWLTGGSSIVKFGEDLAAFAPNFKTYADTVSDINPTVVTASANAAKALAEMANCIPNSGGLISWFAGDNSVAAFADELPVLGRGLKAFADEVTGINPETILAASNAAKNLAEMTNSIPNSGGVISWFAGDNSLSKFGKELSSLGSGLKGFSDKVSGVNPEALVAAADAAKPLVELTNEIPNSGGVASWFAGDNSISKFGADLKALGKGLKNFSDEIAGVDPENVMAASDSAKALAEMTNSIPNTGGMVAWFTGDNSLSKFASELPKLGEGLKGFSDSISGINPENVTAAAYAAKALAEMSNTIPNSGGVVSWFTGDNSLSKFSKDLKSLGSGLKGFSEASTGINPESVIAAVDSAKILVDMTNNIPNSGGVISWFTGDNSLSNFADQLPKLGRGLKRFSESTEGINSGTISSAANSAKALAEMTQFIPKEGGIKSWFTGDTSIANFADKLPKLGKGLKGFSDSVQGINAENLTAASNAAKAIAEMTGNSLEHVDDMPTLATNLSTLGTGMKKCFSNMGGISPESITNAKNAIKAVEDISSLDGSKTQSIANAIEDLSKSIKELSNIPKNATSEFSAALEQMGNTSAESLLKAFKNIEPDMNAAGKNAIVSFIDGVEGELSSVKSAAKSVTSALISTIIESKGTLSSAGMDLVEGFANGISTNSFKAVAQARAMAVAASQAAAEALKINSPSKVFRDIGYSIPEGFAMGIDKLSGMASDSSVSMANDSIGNVKTAISRMADLIGSDLDAQPTIRPVLDLSEIRSGAKSINGLFNTNSSVGVLGSVSAINSSMKRYNQNGETAELASEIAKLRKDLTEVERATYNINGITYDDGSNISEAIKTLIRAANIERRL